LRGKLGLFISKIELYRIYCENGNDVKNKAKIHQAGPS